MNELSDAELLRDYAQRSNEAAFREIVRRYTDLVYSAAVRQVESADLAGDIAQSIFVDLARKAKPVSDRLSAQSSLAGWLHRSTRYAALNHLRDTRRRNTNERQAMEQLVTNSESAVDWECIRPALDEALDSLGDEEREALLLRYFKNQDFRAVGLALGVSDDAAQKRVSRAVERLREFFAKRGVTVGAGGLVVVISANAVQAAPVGLAVTISTAVTAAIMTTATIATHTNMHWINIKSITAIVAAAIAAGVGTHLVQQRETNGLQSENQNLIAQQKQLTIERDTALSAASQRNDEVEQFRKDKNELLRLRGEIGVLRRQIVEFGKLQADYSRIRAGAPVTWDSVPPTNRDSQASQVTTNTINAMKQISLAVRMYAQQHHDEFPTNLNQITNNLPPWFAGNVKLDAFEFVSHAAPVNWGNKPDTIIVRERVARQTPEGKWARVYGLMDGHVIEQISDDGNFESWEAQHTVLTAPAK